ncbi:hypothetical protein D3C76_1058920 [compost metagenome]
MLEGALILQQRHGQVAAVKQQAALGAGKLKRAGKQQVVLGAVFRPGVAERGLFQANALADQPAAETVPDHQQAFAEEMIRVPELRVVQAQAHPFIFAAQGQTRRPGEQAVKQQAAMECLIQAATVNHGMAHHCEAARPAWGLPEPEVLVVQCQP